MLRSDQIKIRPSGTDKHNKHNKHKKKKKGRDYKAPFKMGEEYINLLDPDRILASTPNLNKLKVTLKRDKLKGTSLFATKSIKKGETIAYYKITVFKFRNYESPTNEVYTFDVYDREGDDIYKYIGDIDLASFPKPFNNIPFWGPFANEPSVDQKANCRISMNLEANYKKRKRVKVGSRLIYRLVATIDIEPGEEVMWYYGKDYIRSYQVNEEESLSSSDLDSYSYSLDSESSFDSSD